MKRKETQIGIEVESSVVTREGIGSAENYFNSTSPNNQEKYPSGTGWGTDGACQTAEFRSTPRPLSQRSKIISEFHKDLKEAVKENPEIDMLGLPCINGRGQNTNGLHITIDSFMGIRETIKLLDMFIAYPLFRLEHKSRWGRLNNSYGYMGSEGASYRDKTFKNGKEAIEYRVLSSQWASSPEILGLVLDGVTEIIKLTQEAPKKASALYELVLTEYPTGKKLFNKQRGATAEQHKKMLDFLANIIPAKCSALKKLLALIGKRGLKTDFGKLTFRSGWFGESPLIATTAEKKNVLLGKYEVLPVAYAFIRDNELDDKTDLHKSLCGVLEKEGLIPLGEKMFNDSGFALPKYLFELSKDLLKKKQIQPIIVIRGSNEATRYKTSFNASPYFKNGESSVNQGAYEQIGVDGFATNDGSFAPLVAGLRSFSESDFTTIRERFVSSESPPAISVLAQARGDTGALARASQLVAIGEVLGLPVEVREDIKPADYADIKDLVRAGLVEIKRRTELARLVLSNLPKNIKAVELPKELGELLPKEKLVKVKETIKKCVE